MALNGTQKNIMDAIFDDYFQEIEALDQEKALAALRMILKTTALNEFQEQQLAEWGIAEIISKFHEIYDHECPQNRAVDRFGNVNVAQVEYKDRNGNFGVEPQGILGLTAYNDDTAEPVTKEDVDRYVQENVQVRVQAKLDAGVVEEADKYALKILEFLNGSNEMRKFLMTDSINFRKTVCDVEVLNFLKTLKLPLTKAKVWYEESPDKLKTITSFGVRNLVLEHKIPLSKIEDWYQESPDKLKMFASQEMRSLMEDYGKCASLEKLESWYEKSPEKLSKIVSYAWEKEPTEKEFKELLKQEFPAPPSTFATMRNRAIGRLQDVFGRSKG